MRVISWSYYRKCIAIIVAISSRIFKLFDYKKYDIFLCKEIDKNMNMLSNYVVHISNSMMLSSLLIFMIIFGPLFVLIIALAIQEQMNARKEKDVLTEE